MKVWIDLGGSHIAVGLVNNNNEIVEKRTYYIKDNEEISVEEYIINSIEKGIEEILVSNKLTAYNIDFIGIATPGNPKDEIIRNVVNLDIKEFALARKLHIALGPEFENIKIRLKNDGKCAALAEKTYGSLKEYKDCIFLCIGTGIGGAAFIDNKFLQPARNSGFEFGHMVIKKDGEKCNCGNRGCFEAYCSKKKFKEKLLAILNIDEYLDAPDLINEINKHKDNLNIKILIDEYVDNLALGISNIINIFEPEAISIGGSMSHYEELIFDKLRNKIYNGKYLFNKEEPPKIFVAQAGNDAGIIGATLMEE